MARAALLIETTTSAMSKSDLEARSREDPEDGGRHKVGNLAVPDAA